MHNTAFLMVPQRPVLAYFDPFDVFSLLKRDLYDNLPLVNLHWNHPARPLRLIATLDVDIVEEKSKASLASEASTSWTLINALLKDHIYSMRR